MRIIETKPNLFIMIFTDKNEYQVETIKILLDEERDVVWNGKIEDIKYNKKLRLFHVYRDCKTPADVNHQWNCLINVVENPKYMICYWVRRTDEERKEYQKEYVKKFRNGKK